MERTNRDFLNGEAQPAPMELFSLRDPHTGNVRSVREMTDQELARYISEMERETVGHQNGIIQAIETCITARSFASVMRYEVERRKIALTIASTVPA